MNTSYCQHTLAWWSHGSGPQLTCTEAVESLKRWEGVEGTVLLFNDLLKEEQGQNCYNNVTLNY